MFARIHATTHGPAEGVIQGTGILSPHDAGRASHLNASTFETLYEYAIHCVAKYFDSGLLLFESTFSLHKEAHVP